MDRCPLHPRGGCGFARHGTYPRSSPPGNRVARCYCPLAGQTFSLLPDCLAARFPGTLAEIEQVIETAEQAPSREAAADELRTDIELPGALRWSDQRRKPMDLIVDILKGLIPVCWCDCAQTPPLFSSASPLPWAFDHRPRRPVKPIVLSNTTWGRTLHHDRHSLLVRRSGANPRGESTMSAPQKSDDELRQEIALFRYGLIAEFLQLPPGTPGLMQRLEAKAALEYRIPGSHRTRVAAETLRDWIKRYRNHGGFEALLPKPRADRGRPRSLPAEITEQLIAIKEANPELSVRLVIAEALASRGIPQDLHIPPSSVHRLLSREGLISRTARPPLDQDRRRFAFEHAGQLWSSDVMHGPTVTVEGGRRRKTYLIAFIDDATRVIPYAEFAIAESTRAFLPVFKQALLRRALPERLYVDNGANYRSRHLSLVCAKLGVALIHARPYRPQGKGKIERFFRTVRAQLLTRLKPEDTASLENLNRRLWAWVEGEYHHTPHRGLDGDTPLERWARSADRLRRLEPHLDIDDLFLFEAVRKVQKDRTVSLDGRLYEVDAALIGENVTLRYDPHTVQRSLQVHHDGQFINLAKPVDLYANCFVKRNRPTSGLSTDQPPPEPEATGMTLHRKHRTEER